jgi:hypothetical protein
MDGQARPLFSDLSFFPDLPLMHQTWLESSFRDAFSLMFMLGCIPPGSWLTEPGMLKTCLKVLANRALLSEVCLLTLHNNNLNLNF